MKKPDWEKQFFELIKERKDQPLTWGENDCCLFACDAIERMTGIDPAEWFRGKYKTKIGAYKKLKQFSGGGILEAAVKITRELGFPEINPLLAGRGDVVYCESIETASMGINHSLGIVAMSGAIAIPGKANLIYLPLRKATRAWKI
jgi:hypothetical protein